MAISNKMTDANRKEMLAGLFLSKFNKHGDNLGLRRLGYAKFKDAYEGLAALVGGNPLSVRNYRDEFDPAFENGRTGYNMRPMHPTRREMLDAYGWMGLEEMAELLEEQFLGTERFVHELDDALASSTTGAEVAEKASRVEIRDKKHFISGKFDPTSSEGKERIAQTKVRVTQSRFRKWVLSIYGGKCCVTGLAVPDLLRASHIVGWADDIKNRMNPSNGLCLSATYDAAFDRHLISFDDDYRMILSKTIKDFCSNEIHKRYFVAYEGKPLLTPTRFPPDKYLLAKHREGLV
jgi:hypothetical protein